MNVRRSLTMIGVVAALHALFFIWYQRPDWFTQWSDQEGYRRLGAVLAETGKFTRFPDAPRFVPEVLRTPVYPLFVAMVYRLAGTGQMPVALAQAVVFVLICFITYATARHVASPRLAAAAAAATALFSPIPYFGALVMTEVWTTFLFMLSMWMLFRALDGGRAGTFVALGVLLGVTALSRPVFVLFPIAIAAVILVLFPLLRAVPRPAARHVAAALAAFALTMLPWFTYNYVTLGRFTMSPAGGIGRGLWEGSWQSTWSGRFQNDLTHLADEIDDRAELDRRIDVLASREQLPAAPMREYVHQWQDIRRIWTEPVDPYERAVARVKADQEYGRVGLDNLRRDSWSHLARRLARGVFILWAGELPFRYSAINTLPPLVIRFCWGIQALIACAALVGLYALARDGRRAQALLLASPLVYITAVHFPLLTEARQSLPAQPVLLILATLGVGWMTGHSLALETQVHERERL